MKLVHMDTGKEVKVGDIVTLAFSGKEMVVDQILKPEYAGDTIHPGIVYVSDRDGAEDSAAPIMFNLKWEN